MLTTLRISGFAIVDAVEVAFGPGLNVLTGETGAGKSILLEALHLVLGGRMSADALREGAEEAVVEALFELPAAHPVLARLEAVGLPAAGGELLVRRTAARGGRGRAFVNGALCTVGMLEGALRGLVDMTGQHEHVALLDAATHLALLDGHAVRPEVAGEAHATRVARYGAVHAALSSALRERAALRAAEEERARRAEYLVYQLREIEVAGVQPGEDEALARERHVLASAGKLRDAAAGAEALVYGDEGSACERVGRALRAVAEGAGVDVRLEPPLALLRSAQAELEEASRLLGRYGELAGGDPERLAAVEERLELLRAVARKHGGSLAAALERAAAMRVELSQAEDRAGRLARLEADVGGLEAEAARLARELSSARRAAAGPFCAEVERELARLAMGRCRVEVAFLEPEAACQVGDLRLGAGGAERAQVLIAPNAGEPARPLARVASGGELSRVLLAVKRAASGADPVGASYVFDEVDAGVGGAVAEAVGRVLWEVGRERQVISVTHSPQVAAFADRHLRVEKRLHEGRTVATVRPLDGIDERRGEVARMLAGLTVTDSALAHAGSLLAAARCAPRAGSRRAARAASAARVARPRSSRGVKGPLRAEGRNR